MPGDTPQPCLRAVLDQNRHVVPDRLAVEQVAFLGDDLLDECPRPVRISLRETVDDLGYGVVFVFGALFSVHRISLFFTIGPVNSGATLKHRSVHRCAAASFFERETMATVSPTLIDIVLPATPGGSFGLATVLGVPAGPGPWPGVVLVHEAFGLNDVMRRQVERMAAAGYLALMPDLFSEGGARRCLVATFRSLSAGEGRAFVDIESARTALGARADCTGAVGVLGFCMGGGFALAAAARGFDAASANYGMLPGGSDAELDDALTGACPIVGSYGGRDRSLRGAARRLDASLSRLAVPHDVVEYPGAGHAFLNDAESGPVALRFALKRCRSRPRRGRGCLAANRRVLRRAPRDGCPRAIP